METITGAEIREILSEAKWVPPQYPGNDSDEYAHVYFNKGLEAAERLLIHRLVEKNNELPAE